MWIEKSSYAFRYGKKPEERSIEELLKNGFIVLDKWAGPTSHDVVATVKKILERKKAGHTGTLDPQVTGVLPIFLDNACKAVPVLHGADKEYVGIMHLHKDVADEELEKAVKKYTGKIEQKPPVRSAVKREKRKREIFSFEILDRKERDVVFRVSCEAGTYIRVLCHQIGSEIGGAHMKELRRIRAGPFSEEEAVRSQDLADAYIYWKEGREDIRNFVKPVEYALRDTKKIIIKDSAIEKIMNGAPLYYSGVCKFSKGIKKNSLVAIMSGKGELVALAKANFDDDIKSGVAAKPDRVIMSRKLDS